jgi:hypothetical protein
MEAFKKNPPSQVGFLKIWPGWPAANPKTRASPGVTSVILP